MLQIVIKLTEEQEKYAEKIGRDRQRNAELRGANATNILPSALQIHIWGAKAEYAASLYLNTKVSTNLYTIDQYHNPSYKDSRGTDLHNGVEVRSTSYPYGELVVRKKDWDFVPYLLVFRKSPVYTLIGWCYGYEAKQSKYWKDVGNYGRPAWFVPQDDLHPVRTLKQTLEENEKYGIAI